MQQAAPRHLPSQGLERSLTPPRTAAPAPIRLLRIVLDENVLGGVEVNEASSLADVRQSIEDDEIPGVPDNYLFVFSGAPVSRRQEVRRRAAVCFPFLTIIQEHSRIAPSPSVTSVEAVPTSQSLPQVFPVALPAPSTAVGQSLSLSGAGSLPEPSAGSRAAPPVNAGETEAPQVQRGIASTLEMQITDGPLEGMTITVGPEGARIGRHTSNSLVIPEAGISRFHFEVCFTDGEFCVKDPGSTTGTYFFLRPHGRFQMFPGLMVKFGETEMHVLSTSGAGAPPEQVVLFCEGPLAGHKVRIDAEGITMGRSHDNTLVFLQDGTVSAHHAMIFFEDGEFYISDLGSCNGTCIRLSAERTDSDWHPIMDGDVLGAGCTKVRCCIRPG